MNLRMRRNQWINDKCILLSASHYLFSTLASWISKPYSCTVKTIDLILHLLCVCVCVCVKVGEFLLQSIDYSVRVFAQYRGCSRFTFDLVSSKFLDLVSLAYVSMCILFDCFLVSYYLLNVALLWQHNYLWLGVYDSSRISGCCWVSCWF